MKQPLAATECYQATVGCLICGGTSILKLQQLSRSKAEFDTDLDLRLKFFSRTEAGKKIILNLGDGLLIRIKPEPDKIHRSGSGTHITGAISCVPRETCNALKSCYFRGRGQQIPTEWIQVGHLISFIHRGLSNDGLVINIINPETGAKMRLRTT